MSEPGRGSDSISPTAHYTGYVWARNGLSAPELTTTAGRIFFNSLRPAMAISHAAGGPTLEDFLLARHRLIDHLLDEAIGAGRISQVLEIASGLSPRGLRFGRRYGPSITYVEADLPAMAARKREALGQAGSLGDHHRVVEIDALAAAGPHSLGVVASELEPQRGLAIITEGLVSYLDDEGVAGLWRRVAETLSGFAEGLYLSDLHLAGENRGRLPAAFLKGLSLFVRSPVRLHFTDVAAAKRALEAAGFARAALHRPSDFADRLELAGPGSDLVRVIEASR